MAIYFVTGNLGGGKTLVSVSRIVQYLNDGKRVATNLDLDFMNWLGSPKSKKIDCVRLPDQPTATDINDLGYGNKSPDESKNGLLVFDECGTWFNSQEWNQKGRREFVDCLLHIRKKGWDVIFIVQHLEMIDKQARQALAEHTVICRRLDRINIPIISTLSKLVLGSSMPLPKVHVGTVKYGSGTSAMTVDRWIYRGTDLYDFYDTKQIFSPLYENGSYNFLPPFYLVKNNDHLKQFNRNKVQNLRKRLWCLRPPKQFFFVFGLILSSTVTSFFSKDTLDTIVPETSANPSVETLLSDSIDISNLKLKGHISHSRQDHFIFELDGEPFNPLNHDFKVTKTNYCQAVLHRIGFHQILNCEFDE